MCVRRSVLHLPGAGSLASAASALAGLHSPAPRVTRGVRVGSGLNRLGQLNHRGACRDRESGTGYGVHGRLESQREGSRPRVHPWGPRGSVVGWGCGTLQLEVVVLRRKGCFLVLQLLHSGVYHPLTFVAKLFSLKWFQMYGKMTPQKVQRVLVYPSPTFSTY